ncbi:hypothetical protein K5D38_12435 [Pseudomonas cichorii]|nr:hypothetical protein [Pseudomonas cichorii]MBX8475589.1 hypothetical protein [Pseudomonas cichorii]
MNTLAHWRTRANALLAVSIISTATLQSPVSLTADTQSPTASVATCPAQDFDGE